MHDDSDFDVNGGHVAAAIYGEEGSPLSKLAARTDSERAEHFEFTDEDRELLAEVLPGKSPAAPANSAG